MKTYHLLPLVAVAAAIVLPSEQALRDISTKQHDSWWESLVSEKDRLLADSQETWAEYYDQVAQVSKETYEDISKQSRLAFHEAVHSAHETANDWSEKLSDVQLDAQDWIEDTWDDLYDVESYSEYIDDGECGHHGDHGRHGRHGRHGHHGDHGDHPPHHKQKETVYNLIASSKYSTKLAKLINKYPDLVKALNSTDFNSTVFAPTDKAFDKIPEKVFDKLSKKQVGKLLAYHVVPGFYPAKRVLFTNTAATALKVDTLSSKEEAQRVTFRKGFKGITVNFYSRIIAANIHATNGIIHGVDTPIFPPIGAIREIDLFPGAFSTLELGLQKAGLLDELNTTNHDGGTLFAPNNWAWQKLGPKINAFLFSPPGHKYLKALLQYHVVPENTLYTDAYYKAGEKDKDEEFDAEGGHGGFHVDLPTALDDHSIGVDVRRYGPVTIMKVNGFTRVAVPDVVAEDGVIHVMTSVIIPPRKADGKDVGDVVEEEDGEWTVEGLKERLEPYVKGAWKNDL